MNPIFLKCDAKKDKFPIGSSNKPVEFHFSQDTLTLGGNARVLPLVLTTSDPEVVAAIDLGTVIKIVAGDPYEAGSGHG